MTNAATEMVHRDRHRYRNPVTGMYGFEDWIDVPILLIEYREVGNRWLPSSVETVWDVWDVEWCKRDESLYFHLSGCGARLPGREYHRGYVTELRKRDESKRTDFEGDKVEFHGTCELDPKYRHGKLWVNREFVNLSGPLPDDCELVDEPIEFDGIVNPTEHEMFEDTPTEYCEICDDRFPDDDTCDHLWWCDSCCATVGPGAEDGECGHEENG